MRESDYRLLQGFPIFRTLQDSDFVALADRGEMIECGPQRILGREGEAPKFFICVY